MSSRHQIVRSALWSFGGVSERHTEQTQCFQCILWGCAVFRSRRDCPGELWRDFASSGPSRREFSLTSSGRWRAPFEFAYKALSETTVGKVFLRVVQLVGRSVQYHPLPFVHSDWSQTGPFRRRRVGVEATMRAAHRVKWCFRPQSSSLFMVWTGENARFHGNRPTIGRLRSAFRRWLFFPLFGRWRELDLSAADGSNSCRRVPMSST